MTKAKLLVYEKGMVRNWLTVAKQYPETAEIDCPFMRDNRGLGEGSIICRHPVCRSWFPKTNDQVSCPCYHYTLKHVVAQAEKMVATTRKVGAK